MNSFRPAQGGWVCDTAHIMKGAGTDDAKKELVERVAVVAAREADGARMDGTAAVTARGRGGDRRRGGQGGGARRGARGNLQRARSQGGD